MMQNNRRWAYVPHHLIPTLLGQFYDEKKYVTALNPKQIISEMGHFCSPSHPLKPPHTVYCSLPLCATSLLAACCSYTILPQTADDYIKMHHVTAWGVVHMRKQQENSQNEPLFPDKV